MDLDLRNQDLHAILVRDVASYNLVKTGLSTLSGHKVQIVDSLEVLTEEQLNNCKYLVLIGEFPSVPGNVSDLRLLNGIFDLNIVYLGKDTLWFKVMEKYAKCYTFDISRIDYLGLSKVLREPQPTEELEDSELKQQIEHLLNYESISPKAIRTLEACLSLIDIYQYDNIEYKQREEQFLKLSDEANSSKLMTDKVLKAFEDMTEQVKTYNKKNREYERILSRDVYHKINLEESRFYNSPTIIYLKEYQELIHFNSFLETLYYTLNNHRGKSVKVVRLYDKNSTRIATTIPDYYLNVGNNYDLNAVKYSDYIVKFGDYVSLLENILINEQGLDILIIVDCKSYRAPILIGKYINFNLCRNEKLIDKFEIEPRITVVNNSKENAYKMSWDTTEEYTLSNKCMYLSSSPVISEMLGIIDNQS